MAQIQGPVWLTQSISSKGICTVIFRQDFCGKGNMRKFYWNTVEKRFKLGMIFVNRAKKLFLSVYVDDVIMADKTKNMDSTWKILLKGIDMGEPTSFLDHVCLGCTQKECARSNDIVTNHRDMFESRISVEAKEKPPTRASGKLDAEIFSSWSYDMEVMQRNVWKDIANLRTKRLDNFTKSQRHAWMTINFKKRKMSQ